MEGPNELSLSEIRKYMLENGCKVTNHALVKHFKRFLTHPETQSESWLLFCLCEDRNKTKKKTCCFHQDVNEMLKESYLFNFVFQMKPVKSLKLLSTYWPPLKMKIIKNI